MFSRALKTRMSEASRPLVGPCPEGPAWRNRASSKDARPWPSRRFNARIQTRQGQRCFFQHRVRRARRTLIATLLAITPPAAGQTTAQLRARADSLLRDWRQANTLAILQDSMRLIAARPDMDTIRVGALIVVANPSALPIRAAAAQAWSRIERYYGSAPEVLALHPIVIQAVDPDTTVQPPRHRSGLQVPWNVGVQELTALLVGSVDLGVVDPDLREWLGGAAVLGRDPVRPRERAYVQLVTAPSRAVRQCFLGDVPACRDALSLTDAPDLLTRWYGPHERRALVTSVYAVNFSRGAPQTAFRSCHAGSDSACLRLLESLPQGALLRPLDHEARFTLLELALRLGGRPALPRLLATKDQGVAERLAAAAGIGVDSLVAHWCAEIRAARPVPVALPPWGAWVAIGWMSVFAAFGLGSSRWRAS